MRAPRTTTPPRQRLTRDRVLDAAVKLADADGLEALSMRRLAKALGVEAMTLYYHVGNKDELVNAIVDRVESRVELPKRASGWREAVRQIALSYREVLREHPWAAAMALRSTGDRPARWRYMDAMLGALAGAGLRPSDADHAYHVLDSYITGYTLWVSQLDMPTDDLDRLASSFLDQIGDAYPNLADHVRWHIEHTNEDGPGTFAFGLDLILDSLERLRDRTA